MRMCLWTRKARRVLPSSSSLLPQLPGRPQNMASRAVIPLLVGMMLLTGVCNTLLTKYQV